MSEKEGLPAAGRSVRKKVRALAVIVGVVVFGCAVLPPAFGQTIIDEWATVKAPPPPELKPVTIDSKTTALLMLDFVKQICGKRPRCVASLPRVEHLLTETREKGVAVIFSLAGQPITDVLPQVAPNAGEPSVSSGPDKFLNTELDHILKQKGIKTVIVVGTAAEGAVLNTAAEAALRGYNVIVPLDGVSSSSTYAEQYTAWHLANAPRIGAKVTLTRIDMIRY
jgi:nicotinamidase-related amidase